MLIKPEVLHAEIRDKEALYASYMPFIKDGGIFLPTEVAYDLNDDVFVILKLPFDKAVFKFMSKVVWINPTSTNKNKPTGVGLRVDIKNGGAQFMSKIESIVGVMTNSARPTFTI